MSETGFFKEFAGLVKKHFLNKKTKGASHKDKEHSSVSVGSRTHDSANIADPAKQAEIETLCEKLFEQKDMITSGKLNFIGLDKVKKRFGKSWEGIKPIVFETADSVIRKYMEKGDLFIRYREDIYLIIFARASHEEAHIKAALIAEEIRRHMFEDEREEFQNISVDRDVRTVKTETLRGKQNLGQTIGQIFSGQIDVPANERKSKPLNMEISEKTERPAEEKNVTAAPPRKEAPPEKKMPHVEVIEVETYQKSLRQPEKVIEEKYEPEFVYMPVWDVKRSYLSTYICVLDNNGDGLTNPFDAHKESYAELSHSQKLEHDKAVLKNVIKDLKILDGKGQDIFICCPVHYETLIRDSNFTKYRFACQSIPEKLQNKLFFIVFDCPAKVHKSTLAKFAGPLKNYCRFFCAEVPFGEEIDFVSYRSAGFDSVGINLPPLEKETALLVKELEVFARHAKKNYIPFIFALGVLSTDIISSVIFVDYEFSAGAAIHTHVHKPDIAYKFKYQDLFAKAKEKVHRQRG